MFVSQIHQAHIIQPNATSSNHVHDWLCLLQVKFWSKPGYLETKFLEDLHVELKDLEPKANNCTQV